MPTPEDKALLQMDGWPGGVNNRIRETEQAAMREGQVIPSSQFLRDARNIDLTAEGHPLRRKGYELSEAGYAHSAWACDPLGLFCVVIDGQLLAGPDIDNLSVMAEVNRYNPVSYCYVNDTIYYSNGVSKGILTWDGYRQEWGMPVPPRPVVVGPAVDNPKGWDDTRQVSITYSDTAGREGGASEPVIVGASGSFQVTVPMPLPDGVLNAKIYVSMPNSEILYHVETVFTAALVTVYPNAVGKGRELDTLNLHPPLAGQIVREMNGRIYIARNAKVIFTEALKYHLTRPSQGIYMMSDYITMMEPSTDGLYVGTERGVVFIKGTDPYDVQQIHVSPYAPIEQAVTRVPGEKFGVPVDELPVWWGADGVMVVGLPGGQLRQLTRDRLAVPKFERGAISLREYEGMSHIVSSLRNGADVSNMGATDTVVAEVRQNNIILNS